MAAPSPQAPAADPDEAWSLLDSYLELAPEAMEETLRLKGQILVAGALGKAELVDSAQSVLARSQTACPSGKSILRFFDFGRGRLGVRLREAEDGRG